MENLYKLEKVSKTYQFNDVENHALNAIDLTISEGEVVVILGPSGSGKSTLLNLLSGIDTPSVGKIFFMDHPINKLTEKELTIYRKKYLGFIFQSYNLVSNLTVKENIELGARLSAHPLNIKQIIKAVGLDQHTNKYPYQLSGGQMQRVAIARAIVKNPKVLFCDEPTGALDEHMGKLILGKLQQINRDFHTTMVIVTHNPSIASIGNTVIKMHSGKIVDVIHNEKTKDAKDLRWA